MSAQDFRVLLVMNVPNDRKLIAGMLEKTFRVSDMLQTHTATNALNLLKDSDPVHLVILDLELPGGISGFELIKKLRTVKASRQAAFIMTSSTKDRDTLVKAVSAGVKDYIVRPFQPEKLKQRLHKFFQTNQAKLRESQRVDLFENLKIKIVFSEKGVYKGTLQDLSIGGCLTRTPIFNRSRQTIYDQADLHIETLAPIKLRGELVRLETDPDSQEEDKLRTMKAAFRFLNLSKEASAELSQLLKNPAEYISAHQAKRATKKKLPKSSRDNPPPSDDQAA